MNNQSNVKEKNLSVPKKPGLVRYKMLRFLDIKKTPFWNLGKKVLGVGGETAQKR